MVGFSVDHNPLFPWPHCAEIDDILLKFLLRKLVSWWITRKQGFKLSRPMFSVTLHCKPLIFVCETPGSPRFPITNLSLCLGEVALLLNEIREADLMQHCSSTSWTCLIGFACTQGKARLNEMYVPHKMKSQFAIYLANLFRLDISLLSFTAIINSQRIRRQSCRTESLQ